MTESTSPRRTRNSRIIKAPRDVIYRAFTDAEALAVWLSPGEMTGKVHEFDGREGGGFQAITFDSAAPAFSGEMLMVVTLEEKGEGTEVIIAFENIPLGIRPEDNEAGTESSLEKLARYLE